MDALATKAAELQRERVALKAFVTDHTKDGEGLPSFTPDERTRFMNWTKAIEGLNDEVAQMQADKAVIDGNENALKSFGQPAGLTFPTDSEQKNGIVIPKGVKSFGELVVESEEFREGRKAAKGSAGPSLVIDLAEKYGKRAWALGLKTLFDTSAWTAQAVRLPEPVLQQFQMPAIADLFPTGRTTQNSIVYMEETTATNAAAGTAESASKPESTLDLTEKNSPVKKIATSLPVTSEALEDEAQAESYIDGRLSLFVRMTEDTDLMQGNGGDTVTGIYRVTGSETQAIRTGNGYDTLDDLFAAAMKVVTNAFVQATHLIIHPTDWQTVRLAKDDNGQYLLGPATSDAGVRPWGLIPIVTTAALTGHPVVLNPAVAAQIFRKKDVTVSVGWVNEQFVKNQRTILAEERLAFVVFRPKAIVKGDTTS